MEKQRKCMRIGGVKNAFVLMQQQKSQTEVINQKEIIIPTNKKNAVSVLKVSGPPFRVKNSSAGCATYSCMIATNFELWDIGSVSTEVCDENSAVDNCKNLKAFDVFSQTLCDESVTSEQMEHHYVFEELHERTMEADENKNISVPKFQIKKFEEMAVFASHVVSPSKFYIQRKDTILKTLSEVMVKKTCQSYAERNCIPDIGACVMGWFPEQELCCRAQVTKICGINRGSTHLCTTFEGVRNLEVGVWRIDYGDSACLSLSDVKELCRVVAKVPAQALEVSLANVNPVDGQTWSDEAINWFRDKVKAKTLYARLYPERNRFVVELFTEKGKITLQQHQASSVLANL